MADLDVRPSHAAPELSSTEAAAAARAQLRRQIAGLERRLSDTLIACLPYGDPAASAPALPAPRDTVARPAHGPRLLDLGELEEVRDELAARLSAARAEGIEYHAIAQGALYVHRDQKALDAGIKKMALLAEHGQRQEVLDPGALARLDPVFAPVQGKIAGAIRDLGDSSGDHEHQAVVSVLRVGWAAGLEVAVAAVELVAGEGGPVPEEIMPG